MSLNSVPRVGIGVFVLNKERTRFLFGERKGSIGEGTWALPGGHLELGESFEACAARETEEETGLTVEGLSFMTAVNTVMEHKGEKRHYVTIFMTCGLKDGNAEPKLLEPEKCGGWEWTSWRELLRYGEAQEDARRAGTESEERRLFEPIVNLLRQRPGLMPR